MAPFEETAARFPAGAEVAGIRPGGRWASESQLRRTGFGYISIRYQSRMTTEIVPALQIRGRVESREAAERIKDRASELAPVSDRSYIDQYGEHGGILRDSLYVTHLDEVDDWAVASDVHYAPYVEFGTRNMDAQPYLIPALEEEHPGYVAKMAAMLQRL